MHQALCELWKNVLRGATAALACYGRKDEHRQGCRLQSLGMLACRMLANALFPNWLVTMLLLALLIFLTYKTSRKAWTLHRHEVKYLAQQIEERPRAANSRKRPPAADGSALDTEETVRNSSAERSIPERGSAASAEADVEAGQAGTCEGSRGSQKAQGMHSMAEETQQPGPLRQFASLEVEAQPSGSPQGEALPGCLVV